MEREWAARLKGDPISKRFEFRAIKKSGEIGWCEVYSTLIQYKGKPAVMGNMIEITDRKLMEEKLRQSEQRFRSLAENAPDIIYGLDLWGNYVYVSPAWKEILGHEPGEVVGKNFVDFVEAEDRDMLRSHFRRIRNNKETLRGVTATLVAQDGSARLFDLSGGPNFDSSGNVTGVVGLLKDITHHRELELQLQQAQKMEAVGTLAGGIAHDFNNILQAIQGYTDLMLMDKNETDEGYRELQEIKRSARRGSELTRQLLTFSRKVESNLRPLDLNQQIDQISGLLSRTLPKMVIVEKYLSENLKVINGDPSQIEQIILNIAINARDAMPKGGKLIIETSNVTFSEEFCKRRPDFRPGDYVCLSISDTGHGMDQDTLQHIFEPFYTTKEVGKGTGLGLAMTYGIVKNHGGYIVCKSEPGKGTTFKIYFPALELDTQEPLQQFEETAVGGNETILVVDDESFVRDLAGQALSRFGYKVVTASSGEKALEIYKNRHKEIDLIILDLIMPGMGGPQCFEELLKINPNSKVLIASGYSHNGPSSYALSKRAKGFLNKPYEIKEMVRTVRKVLNE